MPILQIGNVRLGKVTGACLGSLSKKWLHCTHTQPYQLTLPVFFRFVALPIQIAPICENTEENTDTWKHDIQQDILAWQEKSTQLFFHSADTFRRHSGPATKAATVTCHHYREEWPTQAAAMEWAVSGGRKKRLLNRMRGTQHWLPPSSVTPHWLLTWFTSRHLWGPDQESVKYARRLNIFPSSLQVHKHVLPKWKAIMLNHQLIISSSIYSTT